MEFRDLVSFVTVAEELHFTRAAEQLYMSQPPLTRQIRALEAEVGFDLFDRSTRSVELTPAGSAFLEYARRAVETTNQAIAAARLIAGGGIGTLTVGFVGSASLEVFPHVIPKYRRRAPEVELRLLEMNSDDQMAAIEAARIDVGISRADRRDGIESFVVSRSRLVVAMHATNPLAALDSVDLDLLKNEDFVAFPKRTGRTLRDVIDDLCRDHGFSPRIVQVAMALHAVISLVSSGLGIAIVPESTTMLHFPGVKYVPINGAPEADVRASYREADRNPVLESFIAVLREQAIEPTR